MFQYPLHKIKCNLFQLKCTCATFRTVGGTAYHRQTEISLLETVLYKLYANFVYVSRIYLIHTDTHICDTHLKELFRSNQAQNTLYDKNNILKGQSNSKNSMHFVFILP